MVKNAVRIFNTDHKLLGSGLLLDKYIITADHILSSETNYFASDDMYPVKIQYTGREKCIDIAVLAVNTQEKYKPDMVKPRLNDPVEILGFPQGAKFQIYPHGRHVSGKVISFNFIDISDDYCYRGDYVTVASNEEVTRGFSGAPVFVGDALLGLVARIHIDSKLTNFNVIPVSYFLEAEDGIFRSLFGRYINNDRQSLLNKSKKLIMNPFHYRSETIDFFGRKEQMNQIFKFCSSEHEFRWWAVTGAGGIGKSRLAYEFAKSLNENVWDAVMLSTYDYDSLMSRTTAIKKNTLIVLDYVQQNIRDIGKWICILSNNQFDYKVRVLLLERYGKSYKTSKWVERINERNCEYDALLNLCYNPNMQLDPPFLVLSSLMEEELISIAQSYYHYNVNASIDSSTVQTIIKQLGILDPGLNRPLYLIFLIDAWIENRDLSKWNKTFILESVLARELHRIKVILKNVIDDDLLVNAYLNVLIYSTIIDGLKYPDDIKVICLEELTVFQEAMKYHRKDIIKLFQQTGFLIEDNEGNLYFEGLKPDLLGEYYIFSNYINSDIIKIIVQKSLIFPQKAYSFYNRLLDDYFYENDSSIRSFLVNADTSTMSGEQFFYFTDFLYERIIRDNRINSARSLKRLGLLYMQNKNEENAIVYAYGLSSMMDEFNLKKTKRLLSELKNLYNEYCSSLEIAVEYAYSLVSVIERKSYFAAKKEFYNLKKLYETSSFTHNMEIGLCYARAIKILCSKEIDIYASWALYKELKMICKKNYKNSEFIFVNMQCLCSLKTTPDYIGEVTSELIDLCRQILCYNSCISWEFYEELRTVFPKFFENEEFIAVYTQCLCHLKTTLDNVNKILSELLLLCDSKFVHQVYGEFITDQFRKHILPIEDALAWLSRADITNSSHYINLIIEASVKNPAKTDESHPDEGEIHKTKPSLKADMNAEIERAQKLIWLSNRLDYKQCSFIVSELKDLFEKHMDTNIFLEYYLIGLITLSKHPNLIADDTYHVLENILRLSDPFLDNISDSYRISVLESISELVKYHRFSDQSILLLRSFLLKNMKEFKSQKETIILTDILYQTKDLELDIDMEEYLESVIVYHLRSSYIQRQYVKFISSRKFDLAFAIEKLTKFHELHCRIIFDFFAERIIQLSANDQTIAYFENMQAEKKINIFIGIYAETILRLFLQTSDKKYYIYLQNLYKEHSTVSKIAASYTMLLCSAVIKRVIDCNELYEQFEIIEQNTAKQNMNILAENYAETILKLFWVKPKQEYYYRLQELKYRYQKNDRIALYYAQLLYYASIKKIISHGELYDQFINLEIKHVGMKVLFLFQKTLTVFVKDSIETHNFSQYINKQKKIYHLYGTLDLALEYCHSLSEVSHSISENENLENYFEVEKIADYFSDTEFNGYLKKILDHVNKNMIAKVKLDNLKRQIQHCLYYHKNIYRVSMLVIKTRNAFLLFHSIDFAIQLCRLLSVLSKLTAGSMLGGIIEEAEILYDQYSDEFSIFKYYMRILQDAIQDNRTLVIEKLNRIERTFVQKIEEDYDSGDEICNNLLTVLKVKNNQKKSVYLKTDSIMIPKGYVSHQPSQMEVNEILDYFYSQGILSKPVGIVIIKDKYVLLDGYDRWFAASVNNIEYINASILAEY